MEAVVQQLRKKEMKEIEVFSHEGGLTVVEASHYTKDKPVSKYLLLPFTLEQINKISTSMEELAIFEDEIIAPYFFKLDGDLSWNLYIICILSDRDYSLFDLERRLLLERGKRYGRKYVIKRSNIGNYVPVAELGHTNDHIYNVNPYMEWYEILSDLDLSFCLDIYNGGLISSYIEGKQLNESENKREPDYSIVHGISEEDNNKMSINYLKFGKEFRPHCWTEHKKLSFVQANLIEGANGSGKTSILEAIELAFTGEISRNNLSEKKIEENWDGQLSLWDGNKEKNMQGNPSSAVQQERERKYYQYRARARVRRRFLNEFYHRYNYFTSEDIYRYAYKKGEKTDYHEEFSRIIFGKELSLHEENWKKYMIEFKERFKQLNNKLEEKYLVKKNIEEELKSRNLSISSSLKSTFPIVKKLLSDIWLYYPIFDQDSKKEEIEKWFEALYPHAKEVERLSEPLDEAIKAGYQNTIQLEEHLELIKTQEAKLQKQNLLLVEQESNLTNLTKLEEQLLKDQSKLSELITDYDSTKKIIDYLSSNILLLKEPEIRTHRIFINDEMNNLKRDILGLDSIIQKWGYIIEMDFEFDNKPSAVAYHSNLQASLEISKKDLETAIMMIQTAERNTDTLKNLLTQIKVLGNTFIKENPKSSICPMCGHNHDTANELQLMIKNDIAENNHELGNLYEQKNTISSRLAVEQANIQKVVDEIYVFDQFQNIYKEIMKYNNLKQGITFDDTKTINTPFQIQMWLKQIKNLSLEMKKHYENLEKEANHLDINGFTLDNINKFQELLNDKYVKEIIASLSSDEGLIEHLTEDIKKVKLSIEGLEVEIENQKKIIANVKLKWESLKKDKLLLSEEKKKIRLKIAEIKRIRESIGLLNEYEVILKDTDKYLDLRISIRKLIDEVRLALDLFRDNESIYEKQIKLEELDLNSKDLKFQIKNCEIAINTLKELTPLKDYIQKFVMKNFIQINDIFSRLHTPKDFDRLELNDQNELIAYRKGVQGETICSINEMSTGQRTAVILSVFFVMHMSMETAPNILLLDEPVANMDDLNVLGLIDFLRQFTLTRNTQIFFTTANPTVANLFRRKFSILKNQFQSYQLHRVGGKHAQVNVQTFLPDQERGIMVENK